MAGILNRVLCMDALRLLRRLPDKCIDLVLSDPSFGVGQRYAWGRETKRWWRHWDLLGPVYWEWRRVIKPAGHIVFFQACGYVDGRQFKYQRQFQETIGAFERITMLKWSRAGVGSRRFWIHDSAIWQSGDGKKPASPEKVIWSNFGPLDDFIPHPTFKPYEGIRSVVEMLTKPGDVVLDSFLGSGTTAVVCHRTGRNWVGTELWPPYCRVANERLALADEGISPYGGRVNVNGKMTNFYRDGREVP